MITVILYGHLAKSFGKKHQLDIKTPAEAVRALDANFKGFKKSLIQNGQLAYSVMAGTDNRSDEVGLHLPFGKQNTLKIIPVIAGAGSVGKIIVGVALIAAAFYTNGYSLYGLQGAGALAASVGASLVLSGVSGLLFAPTIPKIDSYESPENRPNYSFNGPVNTSRQGNCVPVGYGRLIVGSQVISASTETVRL